MSKKEFLSKLRVKLTRFEGKGVDKVIQYYTEIIDDKLEFGMSEEEATNSLGEINDIVESVVADLTERADAERSEEQKESASFQDKFFGGENKKTKGLNLCGIKIDSNGNMQVGGANGVKIDSKGNMRVGGANGVNIDSNGNIRVGGANGVKISGDGYCGVDGSEDEFEEEIKRTFKSGDKKGWEYFDSNEKERRDKMSAEELSAEIAKEEYDSRQIELQKLWCKDSKKIARQKRSADIMARHRTNQELFARQNKLTEKVFYQFGLFLINFMIIIARVAMLGGAIGFCVGGGIALRDFARGGAQKTIVIGLVILSIAVTNIVLQIGIVVLKAVKESVQKGVYKYLASKDKEARQNEKFS